MTTIKRCGEAIKGSLKKIHIVIHNAGVMAPPNGSLSVQGIDLQMATNVLAPYLLQKYLTLLLLTAEGKDFTPRVFGSRLPTS